MSGLQLLAIFHWFALVDSHPFGSRRTILTKRCCFAGALLKGRIRENLVVVDDCVSPTAIFTTQSVVALVLDCQVVTPLADTGTHNSSLKCTKVVVKAPRSAMVGKAEGSFRSKEIGSQVHDDSDFTRLFTGRSDQDLRTPSEFATRVDSVAVHHDRVVSVPVLSTADTVPRSVPNLKDVVLVALQTHRVLIQLFLLGVFGRQSLNCFLVVK
mmetsp:Transcript_30402/g.44978  ORF Transcript_30402/g.44978 Transcript_30402/m.44978 type:complete len:212 (+) Transcript_30402:264-899(+)